MPGFSVGDEFFASPFDGQGFILRFFPDLILCLKLAHTLLRLLPITQTKRAANFFAGQGAVHPNWAMATAMFPAFAPVGGSL